jgi:hypothetical protein
MVRSSGHSSFEIVVISFTRLLFYCGWRLNTVIRLHVEGISMVRSSGHSSFEIVVISFTRLLFYCILLQLPSQQLIRLKLNPNN